jgi:predicted nuclease with TOPRIM domain
MKNSPYFKIIITTIVAFCLGFLIPNTNYFKNKTIKQLETENEKLHSIIEDRNKKMELLDTTLNNLKVDKSILEKDVNNKNIYITFLEHKIDSVNSMIYSSDTTITKIKKNGYEEINTINNWNLNQRIEFFSDIFKRHNN